SSGELTARGGPARGVYRRHDGGPTQTAGAMAGRRIAEDRDPLPSRGYEWLERAALAITVGETGRVVDLPSARLRVADDLRRAGLVVTATRALTRLRRPTLRNAHRFSPSPRTSAVQREQRARSRPVPSPLPGRSRKRPGFDSSRTPDR